MTVVIVVSYFNLVNSNPNIKIKKSTKATKLETNNNNRKNETSFGQTKLGLNGRLTNKHRC